MKFLQWLFKSEKKVEPEVEVKPAIIKSALLMELQELHRKARKEDEKRKNEWYIENKERILEGIINECKIAASKEFSSIYYYLDEPFEDLTYFRHKIVTDLNERGLQASAAYENTARIHIIWW